MEITCPCCDAQYPVEAGLADGDGKRLAVLFGEFDPIFARAAIGYLRLFKPPKTALRMARAVRIVQELSDLVRAGSVCRDERNGTRRPAAPAVWLAGIEQMLAARERLRLPLDNHAYLRSVVYGLADIAGAAGGLGDRQEPVRKPGTRTAGPSPARPSESPLTTAIAWARQQLEYGGISQEEHDKHIADARARYGDSQ